VSTVNPEVADALSRLRDQYGRRLASEPDGAGGALVAISRVRLGSGCSQASTTLRFILPFNFPSLPPYPYYVPRTAGPKEPWPPALQPVEWRGDSVIQISLRNNNWNPGQDSIVGCVMHVAAWLGRL
jgi:hypothetical protein